MKNIICIVCGHHEHHHARDRGCGAATYHRLEGSDNPTIYCDCSRFLLDDGVFIILKDCELDWRVGCDLNILEFNPNGVEMKQQIYAILNGWA